MKKTTIYTKGKQTRPRNQETKKNKKQKKKNKKSEPKSVALFSSSLVCAILFFSFFFLGFLCSSHHGCLPSRCLQASSDKPKSKKKKEQKNVRAQVRGSLLIFLGVFHWYLKSLKGLVLF